MALTDPITKAFKDAVIENLGEFFPVPYIYSAWDSGAPPGISESFMVWTIPLESFRGGPLSEGVEWNGVWHHQIGPSPGRAEAYSRSWEGSEEPVRAVYRSSLAQELDQVIDAVDDDKRFKGDDWSVRLLTIPEINLTTVWVAGVESYFIPLGRFARPGRLRLQAMTLEDLRAFLSDERPIVGLG